MDELICNYKKCRKVVKGMVWVTSCSHIFCEEDGTREFGKTFVCPACETNLSGKFDIVRTDLSPTDQYKSMILAGHRPETIMEIASRGLAFWSYQMHQEKAFQAYMAQKAKESKLQLENYHNSVSSKMQHEINGLRSDIASKSKEMEETKSKLAETNEKLQERIRQYQKLQNMYDSLKRRTLNLSMNDEAEKFKPEPSPHLKSNTVEIGLRTAQEHFFKPPKYNPRPRFCQDRSEIEGDTPCQSRATPSNMSINSTKPSQTRAHLLDISKNIPFPATTHIDLGDSRQ